MSEKNKTSAYPDPLAPSEEKVDKAYGLKYAKYIADHWFNGGIIADGCSYKERREWIRNKRLYARGKQGEQRYKDHVSRDNEGLSFMNLDWRPTNFMGKFVRVITSGVKEENYTVNVSALDRLAGVERKELRNRMNENMRSMPMLKEAKELLGIDVTPKGFVPEDEEELKMMVDIKHRPKCEISEEILVNYVLKTNNWHNTKSKVDRDLTEAGIGIVKARTDKLNGITLQYIDPEFFIHSYVRENDFSDMKYGGHIEPTTIGNLKRNSGFDDKILREIAKRYSTGQAGSSFTMNYDTAPMDALLECKVDVLHFTYETSKTFVYKKKKTKHGEIYTERDESYNPKKRSDYERVDKTHNTWFEGSYVIGTDYIYDYREVENMLVDEGDKAMPDYIVRASEIYENKLGSFVDDVEPTLDQMHYTLLKLQHITAEIRPNGANIDLDMLAELESATKAGKMMNWQEILALYQAKGITFSKRADMGESGIKDNSAVQTTANGIPANLPHLLETLRDQYQRVRDITGVNPFRDGSQGERALVGVQQLAFLQSNEATSNIVNASLDITKTTSERISARITEIFESSKLKDLYTRAVGKENMDVVDALKDRNLHEFGFHIQLKPTEQQIAKLNEDLSLCLREGLITVEDKMEAEDLAQINIKMAKEFLKYIRAKRVKERREEEMMMAQNKSQNDIMSAQAAKQAEIQGEEQLAQIRLWEYREKKKIDVMEVQQLNNVNAPVREEKAQTELQKEYLRGQVAMNKMQFMEEEKLKRQNKNNTDHSKMIQQRKAESEPIDFERENMSFKEMMEQLR